MRLPRFVSGIQKKSKSNRQERIDTKGSPYYTFENAEILNGASEFFDFDDSKPYGKYAPYNFWEVQNNSAYDIWVHINGDAKDRLLLNAGVIKNDRGKWIRGIELVNSSGSTIPANKISIAIRREPKDINSLRFN